MSVRIEALIEGVNTGPTVAHKIVVQVTLTNCGTEKVAIPAQVVTSPSLLFEIADLTGANIGFPPPPIPDPTAGLVELAEGEVWQKVFEGFLPPVPDGAYLLRVSLKGQFECISEWAEINVVSDL